MRGARNIAHMHLGFMPLTEGGRLCAKVIIGNIKSGTAG